MWMGSSVLLYQGVSDRNACPATKKPLDTSRLQNNKQSNRKASLAKRGVAMATHTCCWRAFLRGGSESISRSISRNVATTSPAKNVGAAGHARERHFTHPQDVTRSNYVIMSHHRAVLHKRRALSGSS
jgi:hypothetical protein